MTYRIRQQRPLLQQRARLLLPLMLMMLLALTSCRPPRAAHAPGAAPWQAGATFSIGPYLVYLGGARMAVVLEHERQPLVEWREPASTTVHRVTPRKREGLWVAEIAAPRPGAEVDYRAVSGQLFSPWQRFKAGAPRGQRFRFAMFGDTRTNHQVHFDVIQALAQERFDFAIHTGDMVSYGVKLEEWRRFFAIEHALMERRPLLAAMGNHDKSKQGHFRRFFLSGLVSGGKRYFAHDWGDLRVVVLDDEVELRPGSVQHDFIERQLDQGARAGMLLVLATHEPPYSSGKHGSSLAMRRVVHPLARRYGVELVISGHDHNYERSKRIDGVTYVVSGSAGAPIHPVSPSNFSAATRLEPHYVLVDVEPRGLTLRAINLSGYAFDTAVLPPNPPQHGRSGE